MAGRLVARPRLVERLAARWQARAVVIVAGPGFGKSVLLAEAMAENALAPRGVDVLVTCTATDQSPAHLLSRIARVAGLESVPTRLTVEWVAEALGSRWPLGVSLILDDVHHVCSTEDGARLAGALVAAAPPSLHVVLASRTRIKGLAKARLAGDVLEINEEDLTLSAAETADLAAIHDVDPSVPASAGGWPAAAAMAAAYGIRSAAEYLFEAVVDHLDADARRIVAIAAAIGPASPAVLREAVADDGCDPIAVLDRLPLVSCSPGGEYMVHDLWDRVDGVGRDVEVVDAAVRRAVKAFVDREQFDRAFGLCVVHGDWDGTAAVLMACCRRGHAEVAPDVLVGWLDALPLDRRDEPAGLLLRGLAGRVDDPFGVATSELLERAVEGFRSAGNVAGEIAAGVELVYVLRNQGRCEALPIFLARAVELDTAGHVEAAGPAAVARALLAELAGDDREVVARLDAIPPDSLSRDWETVVALRRTISSMIVGDEREMLESAASCARLAGTSNDRHVLALARWFAGDPTLALATCDEIADDAGRSRVDRVFLGTLATMILASSGRTDEAAEQLARVERAASGTVGPLLAGALVGVRALVAAAAGNDGAAQDVLGAALAVDPLDEPSGWRRSARWLPLAYVLLPAVREQLDQRDVGPIHAQRLAVARAVAAAREGRRPSAKILPEVVVTAVPLPWAMVLAARLHADGAPVGGQIAQTLLDLHGGPAKDALRTAVEFPVTRVAAGARRLLATIAIPPARPVRLDLLGPVVLRVGDGEPLHEHWNRERVRSLLLYLVLRGPAHREQIVDALWPHLEPEAAERNLRVTLTYLHQVLEPLRRQGEAPFFIRQSGSMLGVTGRPHLEVDVDDLESLLERAEDADRRGLPSVALDLLEQAIGLWRGPCPADAVYADWAAAKWRDLTARFATAAVRAAELHLAAGHTERAARHGRRALAADEWSEPAYRTLIAAALARGDGSGAARLLCECDGMLAGLGVAAGEQTEMLRRRLAAPHRLSA
jgi:DNA-binding SARP family transcriptional activator